MKKTLSLYLLFSLLVFSAGPQTALASGPASGPPFKAAAIQALRAAQLSPDTWALESADDELPDGVARRAFTAGVALPSWSVLIHPCQPHFLARSFLLHRGIHHPPLYTLLSSYRI